jgi:hypothetical protein
MIGGSILTPLESSFKCDSNDIKHVYIAISYMLAALKNVKRKAYIYRVGFF